MARAPLAFTHLLRAYVLDARGASEALSSAVAWVEADAETLARVHRAVSGKGDDAQARFRAAFARAAGRSQEAIAALREAVAAGDTGAMRPLALAAIEDHDTEALALALSKLPQESDDALLASARQLLPIAQGAPDESNATAGLDALRNVRDPRLGRYADAVRKALLAHFIPNAPKLAAWDTLLTRLSAHCRRRGDLSALAALGDIAQERRSPVRLAIVGEFNAGKSTFINALIGDDVAPTGVLPTTASLHHLRYAQDPIARVLSYEDEHGATRPDRLLPLGNLRAALKATPEGHVRRVEILVPIASLTRVEILDTPGFNAPDPRHAEAARLAFAEADIVLWLLDASQAMKQSERAVLAEARALGMPVQIFVNKVDRMSEAEVAQVLRVVDEGLAAAGLPTWSRVLPLSARLALEGKMGKQSAQSADDALARSGWPAVQRLLDEEIIGRSTELKEGGLRRRTRAIVTTLAALEFERAQALDAAQQDQLQRWHARAARAAVIDADLEAHAEMLQGALAGPLRDFTADLEAARLGRAPSTDRPDDPHIDQYRIERAQARLLGPMTQVLCRMGEKSAAWPPGLEADVARGTQLLLTGFFADDQGRLRSLLRQALRHLVSVLRAPEQLPASSDEKQTLRELEDIAAMLADPTSQSFVVPS
jgi:small GTP-binding protein